MATIESSQPEHSASLLLKWAMMETMAVALIAGTSAALWRDGFRGLEVTLPMSMVAGVIVLPVTIVTSIVVGKFLIRPSGLGRLIVSTGLLGVGWSIARESSGPEFGGLGGVFLIASGLGGLLSALTERSSNTVRLCAAIAVGVGVSMLPPFSRYPPKAVWMWAMVVVLPLVATLLAAVPPSDLPEIFFERDYVDSRVRLRDRMHSDNQPLV